MAIKIAETDENFGLECACWMRMGTFNIEHVKDIFVSFGALFTKLAHGWNMTYSRAKWTKIWASVIYIVCILVFWLNMPRSFEVMWGTFLIKEA